MHSLPLRDVEQEGKIYRHSAPKYLVLALHLCLLWRISRNVFVLIPWRIECECECVLARLIMDDSARFGRSCWDSPISIPFELDSIVPDPSQTLDRNSFEISRCTTRCFFEATTLA